MSSFLPSPFRFSVSFAFSFSFSFSLFFFLSFCFPFLRFLLTRQAPLRGGPPTPDGLGYFAPPASAVTLGGSRMRESPLAQVFFLFFRSFGSRNRGDLAVFLQIAPKNNNPKDAFSVRCRAGRKQKKPWENESALTRIRIKPFVFLCSGISVSAAPIRHAEKGQKAPIQKFFLPARTDSLT